MIIFCSNGQDKKLHPQGDGVFGHGELGMGHGKKVSNAQCPMPKAAGRLSLSTHKGMEFPAAFNELFAWAVKSPRLSSRLCLTCDRCCFRYSSHDFRADS